MGKVKLEDTKNLLSLHHEWHLMGRYANTRKIFFFKTVYVVRDLRPVVHLGLFPDNHIYETLEEAMVQFEMLRR